MRIEQIDQIAEFDHLKEVYATSIIKDLKTKIESMDEEIRNSKWRKDQGYKIKCRVERTILTSEGLLNYSRTKFKRKVGKGWKTTFLVDDYFQIKKNSKLSYELKTSIMDKVAQGYKYEQIISAFPRANITKATISRLIRQFDVTKLNRQDLDDNYEVPKNADKFKFIYISTDDSFLNLKEKRKFEKYAHKQRYRVRLAVLYQGISKKPDKRGSRLINKRVVYALEKVKSTNKNNVLRFCNLLKEKIYEYYGANNWKLVVCGDGDNYIKSVADELSAEIVLDWFHLKMKLRKCFRFTRFKKDQNQINLFELVAKVLKEHPMLVIDNYLKPLLASDYLKRDETKELIRYIRNNLEGIKAYQQDWYIGCATESNVYHFVKSISNSKSWSVKSFSNLLALRVGWINNLKPMKIWKENVEDSVTKTVVAKRYPVYRTFKTPRIKQGSSIRINTGKTRPHF